MLDVALSLYRGSDVLKYFKVNQSLQSAATRETVDKPRMLKHPTNKITCHANVENAVWAICQKINVSSRHAEIVQDVDGRA
jgi:hypothetical protein